MKQLLINSILGCLSLLTWMTGYSQSAYPVSLSSPMDFDTIVETEPNFMWQTDINGIISDVRYSQRFVLCELEENQTKGDAIALNLPLVTLDDYQNITYNYDGSTNPLQMGHTYVWQVQILFSGMQVDQSDVYQFTIFEPADTMPRFYPVVFKNDGQTYRIENGKIGLITDELGRLDLKLNLKLNGVDLPEVYLNELLNGEIQSESTSENGSDKRMFLLDIESLNLDSGAYSATWNPKKGKSYVFNFIVQ